MASARARLTSASDGFNFWVAELAAERGLTPYTVDFASPGRTYFEARLTASLLDRSGRRVFPAMTLFPDAVQTTNRMRGGLVFSGQIGLGIDLFLSESKSAPPERHAAETALALDAMVRTFNGAWDVAAPYAGDLTAATSAVQFGAENWLEVVSFRFSVVQDC